MMRSTMITRTVAALVGLVLLVGACSSDKSSSSSSSSDKSSSSSSSGTALSKEEFLKQGNAICEAGNKETDAAGQKAFGNSTAQPDPAAIKAFANDTLIPSITRQVDAIDKLNPPKDLEAAVDKLVKDAKAAIVKMKALADSDPASLFSSNDPFADVNKEANDIGLTTCGADSGGSSSS